MGIDAKSTGIAECRANRRLNSRRGATVFRCLSAGRLAT